MTDVRPPQFVPPVPPAGAVLPPGYAPPPPGGSMPLPRPPLPQMAAVPAPQQQQEAFDPQAIRIQAAIAELETQSNALRGRCVNQAAQLALAEEVAKRLEQQVKDLQSENARLAAEAATAKNDLEVARAGAPAEASEE